MDALVELFAAFLVALAAATFSQFGVDVQKPQPQTEERAVRRSPVVSVTPQAAQECPEEARRLRV